MASEQINKRLSVIEEISGRMKASVTDHSDRMRVDMFVGDLVMATSSSDGSDTEALIEKVKTTHGFLGANTRFHISDETIKTLVEEAQTKLRG